MRNGFLIIYITCQGLVFVTLLFMLLNRDFSAPKGSSPSWIRGKIRMWRTEPEQEGAGNRVARSAAQDAGVTSKAPMAAIKSGGTIS